MRLISKLVLTAVAAAAVIAGGPALAQQKLKWAHVYETSEPYHTESVWAAAEIKKRTNGKFDIEVFPASSLGKETDINQGMALGTVDMIISGPSFAARSYPRLGIAYYPFIFRDADHLLAYSKSPVFAEMVEEFRKKTGIQILAYTYYGARQTTSNRPFTDCAGMKGLKIRVPDVPAYMATPKSCGANPTPIAFAEVYLALQNGTVDAQENPLTTIEAKKFYEVQKAIMMTSHIVDGLTTQVAPHVWNKLTDQEKQIFTDVTREAAARATDADQEARSRARRRVQEEGPADRAGRPQELLGRRAQELAARVDGLHEVRLRQDRRDQVTVARSANGHPDERSGKDPRLAVASRHDGGFPAARRSCTARRRTMSDNIETVPDDAPVLDESGHFHAVDAPIDISHYGWEDWFTFVVFWLLALDVFYQFFTRYVLQDSAAWTEEIARYLLIVIVFVGASMGVRRNTHIHVEFLYRYLPARVGRALSTASTSSVPRSSRTATYLCFLLIPKMNVLKMTVIDVPMSVIYSFVAAGFALMTFRAVQVTIRHWRQGWTVLERPGEAEA